VTVYLVRHGIAEDAPPGGDDRARRLTARGKAKMREAAAGLAALGVEPDVILTSPLPRAAETAAIVAKALGGRLEPEPLDALATGVTAPEVLRALRPFARHASVMLVGHEPTLSALAALLLTGSTEGAAFALRKGGVIALEVEQLLPPRGAMLVWMLTPRQLRRLAS
jgi:phosphohistidine phosphatase